MTPRTNALAGLAEDVGRALLLYSERLRTEPDPTPIRAVDRPSTRDAPRLGASQNRALDALAEAGDQGLTSGELARQLGLQPTNTPRMLKALQERGLVTSTDDSPAVWTVVSGA